MGVGSRSTKALEGLTTGSRPVREVPPGGWAGREAGAFTFTALREPRARLVSQYHQKMTRPDLFLKLLRRTYPTDGADNDDKADAAGFGGGTRPRAWDAEHPPTLLEFLGWVRDARIDNYHVRYYLGLRGVDRPLGAADLEAAQAVLQDQMDAVLITERLGEAGCLLEQLGWAPRAAEARVRRRPWPWAWLTGRGGGPGGAEEADPTVAALLEELTRLDRRLHAYAVGLFERQLAACECCRG